MRDDGWETPCLQLRHNTKHQPDTDADEIQIQIYILRNMNKLKRLRFLTIEQHLKDLSELSVDQFERVLWQIQVSERIDEILSSIDINLTPARYRVKDLSGFWRIEVKEKEKLGTQLNVLVSKKFSFRYWSTLRNLIVDWKSWEVWKQWETSPSFTHRGFAQDRIPSGNRSLHGFVNSSHSPELHHLRLNPICEDFTCATITSSSLPSHALDVQRRICKSDLIPRRLPRRIFGHDFTVWRGTATDGRPDTHSEPDARFCVGQPTADGEGAALASTCQLRTVWLKLDQVEATFSICFCHRAILATFEAGGDISQINWQEGAVAICSNTWSCKIGMRNEIPSQIDQEIKQKTVIIINWPDADAQSRMEWRQEILW